MCAFNSWSFLFSYVFFFLIYTSLLSVPDDTALNVLCNKVLLRCEGLKVISFCCTLKTIYIGDFTRVNDLRFGVSTYKYLSREKQPSRTLLIQRSLSVFQLVATCKRTPLYCRSQESSCTRLSSQNHKEWNCKFYIDVITRDFPEAGNCLNNQFYLFSLSFSWSTILPRKSFLAQKQPAQYW